MNFVNELSALIASTNGSGLESMRDHLLSVLFSSDTHVEKRRWTVEYSQSGRLLARFERARNRLNGEFVFYYPDGKPVMRGGCRDDELIENSLEFFSQSGELATRECAPNNVVSMFEGRERLT